MGLVQKSADRGAVIGTIGATSHIIDVVWLYRPPLPVEREGDLSKVLL